jgi:hypothetical protein
MSTLKKAAPFVVLLTIGGLFAGTWAVYSGTKEKQRKAREDAFAELSVCLLGEKVPSGDDTINGINAAQARLAHAVDSARGAVDGKPWPQRCAGEAKSMMEAVRLSSLMDETAKVDLLKVLDELGKELELPRSQDNYLARGVLAVWRSAEKSGVLMGEASKSQGPPRLKPLGASPEVPFSGLYSVPGGPNWAFLTDRKDKPDVLAACHLTANDLSCREFSSSGKITTNCSWDSFDYLPLAEDRQLKVLHQGQLVPVDVGLVDSCHIDAAGNFYGVGSSTEERQLIFKPFGKKALSKRLSRVLRDAELAEEDNLGVARFIVGTTLVVDLGETLHAIALGPEAALEGKATKLAQSPKDRYEFVRAGATWYLRTLGSSLSLRTFDGKVLGEPVVPPAPFVGTPNPSGFLFTASSVCSAKGCRSWIDETSAEAFRVGTGRMPSRDMAGERLVLGWAAKEGQGVMLRVSELGAPAPADQDVLISERSDPKNTAILVFGDPNGAMVLAEIEKRVVGARVKADGSVGPVVVKYE